MTEISQPAEPETGRDMHAEFYLPRVAPMISRYPSHLAAPVIRPTWHADQSTLELYVGIDTAAIHLYVTDDRVRPRSGTKHFHLPDGSESWTSPFDSPETTDAVVAWAEELAWRLSWREPDFDGELERCMQWFQFGLESSLLGAHDVPPEDVVFIRFTMDRPPAYKPWPGAGQAEHHHHGSNHDESQLLWHPEDKPDPEHIGLVRAVAESEEMITTPAPDVNWERVGTSAETAMAWLAHEHRNCISIRQIRETIQTEVLYQLSGLSAPQRSPYLVNEPDHT